MSDLRSTMSDTCPVCHTPWPEHDGPTRLCQRLREVTGQLNAVDSVLAGRDALDDKPDRIAKILHAINTAKKVDPLTAERDAAIRVIAEEGRLRGKAEVEAARLRASEATWQECAADRDRGLDPLREALEGVVAILKTEKRLRLQRAYDIACKALMVHP